MLFYHLHTDVLCSIWLYLPAFLNLINKFDSNLCFVPLYPELKSSIYIVWKKNAVFSKPTKKFLEEVERIKE